MRLGAFLSRVSIAWPPTLLCSQSGKPRSLNLVPLLTITVDFHNVWEEARQSFTCSHTDCLTIMEERPKYFRWQMRYSTNFSPTKLEIKQETRYFVRNRIIKWSTNWLHILQVVQSTLCKTVEFRGFFFFIEALFFIYFLKIVNIMVLFGQSLARLRMYISEVLRKMIVGDNRW